MTRDGIGEKFSPMPLPTLPTVMMYRRGGPVVSEFAACAADRDVHGHTFALVRDGARKDTVIEGDPVPTAAIAVGVSAAAADSRPGYVHQDRETRSSFEPGSGQGCPVWSTLGTGAGSAPPAPLIAGPMTNADRENIAAKISSPMAGARSAPKSAVPPDPATSAVPARNPT